MKVYVTYDGDWGVQGIHRTLEAAKATVPDADWKAIWGDGMWANLNTETPRRFIGTYEVEE
jgi:hypothetical protein